MIERDAGWIVAAVCALVAAAVFVWQRARAQRAGQQAARAERALGLLAQIAPVLTQAATESEPVTCRRIVERFAALVPAQTVLCVVARGGQLVLGAKSDSGYAGFLRIGDPCEGDSIVDWVAERRRPALIGPAPGSSGARAGLRVSFRARERVSPGIFDFSCEPEGVRAPGPLVGSRDRVWALGVPMLQERGRGLRSKLIGVLYAERKHGEPFGAEEVGAAQMIARLAGDALLRAQFADDVKRESENDQLTGLLSAGAFRRRLREVVESRQRAAANERSDVALFFIDTDKFKLWNDSFGHVVGDVVLKRLAQIFAEVGASGGFAGRNGGDEFCIALLDRTKDAAIEVAEQMRAQVERTDLGASSDGSPSPRIPATISVGVAHFPVDVPSRAKAPADLLLEAADARMYEAKRAGGNLVAYSRTRALPTKLRYPGEGPIARR